MILVNDCIYSPAIDNPDKYILYFKITKRKKLSDGKKSTNSVTEYYSLTECSKPAGYEELSTEDYEAKKKLALMKKHNGVIDGKEPDNDAF